MGSYANNDPHYLASIVCYQNSALSLSFSFKPLDEPSEAVPVVTLREALLVATYHLLEV